MSRILLLIELKGGNDGLNTVIPYAAPLYRQLRPAIGIARERVVQLDEHIGLHGKLEPLMEAWKARELAVVQGVGYTNPSRSHFRSIEVWDTASSSTEILRDGWIARALERANLAKSAGLDSIVIDTNSLPMMGPNLRTIVMQDSDKFLRQAQVMKENPPVTDEGNTALRHVLSVRREVYSAAASLHDKLRIATPPSREYLQEGGGGLSRQLDLATRIITARVPVVAVKIALGSFDTHANQVPTHERLLGSLASGLSIFRRNMIAAGLWDQVVVLTYSEFGRRAKENASAGTDHGAASALFVLGGEVNGGLFGEYPSLSELRDGDLGYTVDFRDVYTSIARGCWEQNVSFGQRWTRPLGLLTT